jgi:outer membrane scaffolding protein for murein synthesis (MipA/OmpV family)
MLKKLFISIFILCTYAQTKELKLGAGLSFISIPEYIGSSLQEQYILPYPYIYYESEYFTIEKNKLFNHLYNSPNFVIDLSFSGTLPVKSDSRSLRYNMEQLDPTLEVGPNFIYKLFNFNDESYLSIELPIHSVFSVSFSDQSNEGFITNPNLYLEYYFNKKTKLELSTGPTFATKEYYNYFYEVKAKDVTSRRVEYHPSSGYGGWKNTIGLSVGKNNIWYGAFIRHYNLTNVKFTDSPLVNKNSSLFYGAAISYVF